MNALDGIRERRKPLEKLIGQASPEVTRALAGAPVERIEVEAWWDVADVERKRRVARALIDHVTISKATRGGNRFDPSRISPPVWRA